ncbi:MAG: ImmA/IrrE family metallo-endopeptidase [Bacteroidia bacterium]|jgi:hypothetical protein|nr:ImmA/IrrE family metallo-endopeptidase [Bacteroidia bacterium]
MPQGKRNKIQLRRGFKTEAEKKSIEFRKQMSLNSFDRLSATQLAEYFGIPIYTPQEIEGLSTQHLNTLLVTGHDCWSAAVIPLPDKKHIIIHNPKHSSVRQESNLMHELAHVICEHNCEEEDNYIGLPNIFRKYNEVQEDEANWMAGCLHIPREGIVWALKKGMTEAEIGEHFHASMDMVKYRINITGVRAQMNNARKFRYNK